MSDPEAKPGLWRRFVAWVLGWSQTRYGTPALCVVSFTESSFFPIPPDLIQIALTLGRPPRAYYYALLSTIASVLGGVLGWWIGRALWGATSDFFFANVPGFTQARFDLVKSSFQDHAFLAILGAAFTPIPYKVFTISAGACAVDLWTLVLASILGRGGRFFLVAALLKHMGPRVVPWIRRNAGWVTLVIFALIALLLLLTGLG